MRELNVQEIDAVNGGDLATGVSYGGGLVTSAVIGFFSPVPGGLAIAAATYTVSYGITYLA